MKRIAWLSFLCLLLFAVPVCADTLTLKYNTISSTVNSGIMEMVAFANPTSVPVQIGPPTSPFTGNFASGSTVILGLPAASFQLPDLFISPASSSDPVPVFSALGNPFGINSPFPIFAYGGTVVLQLFVNDLTTGDSGSALLSIQVLDLVTAGSTHNLYFQPSAFSTDITVGQAGKVNLFFSSNQRSISENQITQCMVSGAGCPAENISADLTGEFLANPVAPTPEPGTLVLLTSFLLFLITHSRKLL